MRVGDGAGRLRLAALPCLLLAAAVTAGQFMGGEVGAADTEDTAGETAVIAVGAETETDGYVLTEYGGCLALCAVGSDEPMMVTDTPVSRLRGVDRELIEMGEVIGTMDEALRLLEDFSS